MRTEKLQTIIHHRKIPLLLINETFIAFSRNIKPNKYARRKACATEHLAQTQGVHLHLILLQNGSYKAGVHESSFRIWQERQQ
jgi:hypothetical protein